jgi:hypothetical protein
MKIKDLITHLQTLDQEKELVIIATDPTGWDYGLVVDDDSINLEEIYPCEENGLIDKLEITFDEDGEEIEEPEHYVIRLDV